MFTDAVEERIRQGKEPSEAVSKEETQDILGMSDEDIADLDISNIQTTKPDNPDKDINRQVPEEEPKEELPEETPSEEGAPNEVIPEEEELPQEVETEEEEGEEAPDSVYASGEETEVEETEIAKEDALNYKELYEEFMAPFRANGRQIKVDNIADARRLMQMGVDYSRKMESLKAHLRVVKALDQNKLLDPEKVNFLIDVSKGKIEAVSKLLKDHEIDPVSLGTDSEKEYKSESYVPSEQQTNLEEVLDSIRNTDTFDRLITEISDTWDDESKDVFLQYPQLLAKLNEQMANGIYDQVMAVVEREKALGRLTGMSNIAAYKTVGDQLTAKGAFAHLAEPSKSESKPQKDPKVTKARKRAASVPRRSVKQSETSGPNPLSMSDEEFEKFSQARVA